MTHKCIVPQKGLFSTIFWSMFRDKMIKISNVRVSHVSSRCAFLRLLFIQKVFGAKIQFTFSKHILVDFNLHAKIMIFVYILYSVLTGTPANCQNKLTFQTVSNHFLSVFCRALLGTRRDVALLLVSRKISDELGEIL